MKKFLFTLAAMLMSVSAFANCYLYVDPEVNLEDLKGQGEQIISLKAHFDVYCSAWQLRFDIPTGVKITYAEPGTDMKVPYVNARGKNATVDVALANNDTYTEFLAAIMVGGYWQDPNGEDPTAWVTYGVVKWEPGDYENMVDLYVEVDDAYEGGDLVVWTTPSSGTDTRGATCKDNGDEAREQTVPEDQPVEKKDVAAPVITPTVNATTVTVEIAWPTTDGDQVYTGEYTYDRPAYGEADQTYEVEAYTKESDTYKESEHATATITVPAQDPVWQDVVAPVITPTVNATTVTVEITWPTSDGEKVYTGQYTYDRPAYGEADQTYQVEAYTTEKYPYRESAHATATITVPAQDPVWQDVVAPVITPTTGDDAVTVTIEWPTTTGNHVYNGEYSYARGEQDYTVTVEAYTEADYPYSESTHATLVITVPAKVVTPPVQPEAPEITVKTNDNDVVVGATTPEGATEVNLFEVVNGVRVPITNPKSYDRGDQDYDVIVVADAIYPDGTVMTTELVTVTVTAKKIEPPTSIEEILNSENVASVRYFNMAGQEMQEAEGMTIVVVTYTNGTTSAIKVMK